MTVKELIDKLKCMPQDSLVYSFPGYPIHEEDVIIIDHYPLTDTKDPKCVYDTIVYIR